MAKDLYEILNISKDASAQDIKRSFRQLSKKYHPDMQKGKTDTEVKEAEEKFKEINHAYEVLSDPDKKRNYDQFGDENGKFTDGRGFNPFDGFPFDFGNFGGFGGRNSSRNQVQPGKDIQMRIPLSIEDIFNGCTRSIKYKRQVRCSECHGTGGQGQKTCPKCHGTGRIITKQMFGMGSMTIHESICPDCQGTGFTVDKKCSRCNGTGFETKEEILDVVFSTGCIEGEGIVYHNKGSESKNHTGQTGDFIAVVTYKIDKERYEIDGLNVIEHLYIPYYNLLLGCTYTVNIPNGHTKNIKINSCIKEGTIMRLSGEGLRRKDGQHGDYFVCIHYQIPESLSDKEKEQLEVISKLK